jgi:hypothetical protein
MARFRLSRRTFLRGAAGGAAVAVGLPALEAMFDAHGEALADGGPIPKRFGVWFFGNGVRRAHWIPDATGPGWVPKAELAPFGGALKAYVSPVTGLEIKTATHPHHSGMAGIMTGAPYHQVGTTRDTIVSTFAHPSIDQVVAERWAAEPATRAAFRSLEVGITRFRGTDEGTTFQHLSHNGPNNVNPSEYSPRRLYERLFGMPVDGARDAARQSVLDLVKADLQRLDGKVSATDKARLQQHLASIRALELRLDASPAQCTVPARPDSDLPDVNGREPIQEKNEVMSELVALALACDLTRVFSILFSPAGSGAVYWNVGAQNGLHQIAHDERAPGPELQPTLHAATVFKMEQCAYFLERLRSIPEGSGNLLDASGILVTTELSEGWNHTNDEFPILLAGRAGGALRSGVHYRSPNKENTSKALLTLLRAIGDPRASYGVAGGETNQVLSELLV